MRTLFVSDLHLGALGSKSGAFLDFLRGVEAQSIYLVGDILDLWHGSRLEWGAPQRAILDELRARAQAGVRVVYLPGNHDAPMARRTVERHGIEIRESLTHVAADGARYLVLHGDQYDAPMYRGRVMTRVGARLDALLRRADPWRSDDGPAEGPVEALLSLVNRLMLLGNPFEERLTELARSLGVDGVICGHFHRPALNERGGIVYANCGDWVQSLTALSETADGSLRLLQWSPAQSRAEPAWEAEEMAPLKGAA